MPDRLGPLQDSEMTEAQRAASDAIIAGPRGAVYGPFVPLLRSPELMEAAQRMGEYLRYRSAIGVRLSELAILVTAREWNQQVEWAIHAPIAGQVGIPADVIAAIARRERPAAMLVDESVVHDFCVELHRDKRVSDRVYADALALFGEVPVNLPLTPVKLLSIIEGRDIAGTAGHAPAERVGETAVADAVGTEPPAIVPSDDGVPAFAPSVLASGGGASDRGKSAAAAAPAESLIDGDWKMVLSTPVGPQEMTGHFETDGRSLSGHLRSSQGQQSFAGTVEGNRVKFDLKVEKPMKITLKYDVAVDGDKLTGKVKMGIFGSAKLAGERVRVTSEV